jgi:hypothetical protein
MRTKKILYILKMSKTQQKIINSLKETLESSSIHALPNIVRNKYYTIKFVWIVCFLSSSAACGFLIFQSISDYFEYDIVTKIEVKNVYSLSNEILINIYFIY